MRTLHQRPPTIPRPKTRPAGSAAQLLRRYRKPLAAALMLLAAAAGLNLLASGTVSEREVVVAATDLAAGSVIEPSQLEVRTLAVDPSDGQVSNGSSRRRNWV